MVDQKFWLNAGTLGLAAWSVKRKSPRKLSDNAPLSRHPPRFEDGFMALFRGTDGVSGAVELIEYGAHGGESLQQGQIIAVVEN